jgi:hypothetical protein
MAVLVKTVGGARKLLMLSGRTLTSSTAPCRVNKRPFDVKSALPACAWAFNSSAQAESGCDIPKKNIVESSGCSGVSYSAAYDCATDAANMPANALPVATPPKDCCCDCGSPDNSGHCDGCSETDGEYSPSWCCRKYDCSAPPADCAPSTKIKSSREVWECGGEGGVQWRVKKVACCVCDSASDAGPADSCPDDSNHTRVSAPGRKGCTVELAKAMFKTSELPVCPSGKKGELDWTLVCGDDGQFTAVPERCCACDCDPAHNAAGSCGTSPVVVGETLHGCDVSALKESATTADCPSGYRESWMRYTVVCDAATGLYGVTPTKCCAACSCADSDTPHSCGSGTKSISATAAVNCDLALAKMEADLSPAKCASGKYAASTGYDVVCSGDTYTVKHVACCAACPTTCGQVSPVLCPEGYSTIRGSTYVDCDSAEALRLANKNRPSCPDTATACVSASAGGHEISCVNGVYSVTPLACCKTQVVEPAGTATCGTGAPVPGKAGVDCDLALAKSYAAKGSCPDGATQSGDVQWVVSAHDASSSAPWSNATAYLVNDVARHLGAAYRSMQNFNIGREPGAHASWWAVLRGNSYSAMPYICCKRCCDADPAPDTACPADHGQLAVPGVPGLSESCDDPAARTAAEPAPCPPGMCYTQTGVAYAVTCEAGGYLATPKTCCKPDCDSTKVSDDVKCDNGVAVAGAAGSACSLSGAKAKAVVAAKCPSAGQGPYGGTQWAITCDAIGGFTAAPSICCKPCSCGDAATLLTGACGAGTTLARGGAGVNCDLEAAKTDAKLNPAKCPSGQSPAGEAQWDVACDGLVFTASQVVCCAPNAGCDPATLETADCAVGSHLTDIVGVSANGPTAVEAKNNAFDAACSVGLPGKCHIKTVKFTTVCANGVYTAIPHSCCLLNTCAEKNNFDCPEVDGYSKTQGPPGVDCDEGLATAFASANMPACPTGADERAGGSQYSVACDGDGKFVVTPWKCCKTIVLKCDDALIDPVNHCASTGADTYAVGAPGESSWNVDTAKTNALGKARTCLSLGACYARNTSAADGHSVQYLIACAAPGGYTATPITCCTGQCAAGDAASLSPADCPLGELASPASGGGHACDLPAAKKNAPAPPACPDDKETTTLYAVECSSDGGFTATARNCCAPCYLTGGEEVSETCAGAVAYTEGEAGVSCVRATAVARAGDAPACGDGEKTLSEGMKAYVAGGKWRVTKVRCCADCCDGSETLPDPACSGDEGVGYAGSAGPSKCAQADAKTAAAALAAQCPDTKKKVTVVYKIQCAKDMPGGGRGYRATPTTCCGKCCDTDTFVKITPGACSEGAREYGEPAIECDLETAKSKAADPKCSKGGPGSQAYEITCTSAGYMVRSSVCCSECCSSTAVHDSASCPTGPDGSTATTPRPGAQAGEDCLLAAAKINAAGYTASCPPGTRKYGDTQYNVSCTSDGLHMATPVTCCGPCCGPDTPAGTMVPDGGTCSGLGEAWSSPGAPNSDCDLDNAKKYAAAPSCGSNSTSSVSHKVICSGGVYKVWAFSCCKPCCSSGAVQNNDACPSGSTGHVGSANAGGCTSADAKKAAGGAPACSGYGDNLKEVDAAPRWTIECLGGRLMAHAKACCSPCCTSDDNQDAEACDTSRGGVELVGTANSAGKCDSADAEADSSPSSCGNGLTGTTTYTLRCVGGKFTATPRTCCKPCCDPAATHAQETCGSGYATSGMGDCGSDCLLDKAKAKAVVPACPACYKPATPAVVKWQVACNDNEFDAYAAQCCVRTCQSPELTGYTANTCPTANGATTVSAAAPKYGLGCTIDEAKSAAGTLECPPGTVVTGGGYIIECGAVTGFIAKPYVCCGLCCSDTAIKVNESCDARYTPAPGSTGSGGCGLDAAKANAAPNIAVCPDGMAQAGAVKWVAACAGGLMTATPTTCCKPCCEGTTVSASSCPVTESDTESAGGWGSVDCDMDTAKSNARALVAGCPAGYTESVSGWAYTVVCDGGKYKAKASQCCKPCCGRGSSYGVGVSCPTSDGGFTGPAGAAVTACSGSDAKNSSAPGACSADSGDMVTAGGDTQYSVECDPATHMYKATAHSCCKWCCVDDVPVSACLKGVSVAGARSTVAGCTQSDARTLYSGTQASCSAYPGTSNVGSMWSYECNSKHGTVARQYSCCAGACDNSTAIAANESCPPGSSYHADGRVYGVAATPQGAKDDAYSRRQSCPGGCLAAPAAGEAWTYALACDANGMYKAAAYPCCVKICASAGQVVHAMGVCDNKKTLVPSISTIDCNMEAMASGLYDSTPACDAGYETAGYAYEAFCPTVGGEPTVTVYRCCQSCCGTEYTETCSSTHAIAGTPGTACGHAAAKAASTPASCSSISGFHVAAGAVKYSAACVNGRMVVTPTTCCKDACEAAPAPDGSCASGATTLDGPPGTESATAAEAKSAAAVPSAALCDKSKKSHNTYTSWACGAAGGFVATAHRCCEDCANTASTPGSYDPVAYCAGTVRGGATAAGYCSADAAGAAAAASADPAACDANWTSSAVGVKIWLEGAGPYLFSAKKVRCCTAPASWTLTIVGGSVSGGATTAQYPAGAYVTIYADACPSGHEFDKWTVGAGGATLGDATSGTTQFTMPNNNMTVTASCKDTAAVYHCDGSGGCRDAGENTVADTSDTCNGCYTCSGVNCVPMSHGTTGGLKTNASCGAGCGYGCDAANGCTLGAGTMTQDQCAANCLHYHCVSGNNCNTAGAGSPYGWSTSSNACDNACNNTLHHTLTIVGGVITGTSNTTGSYASGEVVNITANSCGNGKIFTNWTRNNQGAFANSGSVATTFTMGASDVTVTANCSTGQTYPVTVNNGAGSGDYAPGARVAIGGCASQFFKSWTVNSGGVVLSSLTAADATFTMPANAVTVTANCEAKCVASNYSAACAPCDAAYKMDYAKSDNVPCAGTVNPYTLESHEYVYSCNADNTPVKRTAYCCYKCQSDSVSDCSGTLPCSQYMSSAPLTHNIVFQTAQPTDPCGSNARCGGIISRKMCPSRMSNEPLDAWTACCANCIDNVAPLASLCKATSGYNEICMWVQGSSNSCNACGNNITTLYGVCDNNYKNVNVQYACCYNTNCSCT